MILCLHYDRLIRRWNSWNSCAIFLNDQDVFLVKVQSFRFYYALSTSDHITIKPCKGCLNQAGGEKASRHLKHWKHALLSFWRLRCVSYMNIFTVAAMLECWLALYLQNLIKCKISDVNLVNYSFICRFSSKVIKVTILQMIKSIGPITLDI